MNYRAVRIVLCLLVLIGCARPVLFGQTAAQPDIYEHFLGVWIGSGVYVENGVRKQTPTKVTITERKDRLRLDYVYGQKGTPDFDRETRFLKLNPSKSTFDLWWEGAGKEHCQAEGLSDFVQSGFGKFVGLSRDSGYAKYPLARITVVLTKDTFSYEWEMGPDEDHMKRLSLYTLTRVSGAIT